MKSKYVQFVSLAASAVAATVLLSGCGTTSGYKQADKIGASIGQFRDEIVKGKAAIDSTVTALDEVAATANTDPRKAFEGYTKALANLESIATKVKKEGADIRAQGQSYFTKWQEEMKQVQNPEIRNLAEQRKATLQATFDTIKTYTDPLKAQFDPWLSDLKDLQKYLSNDLTISGVDAAKPLFAKTRAEGYEVQKSMDGLVAELNTVAATLTPAKVEPKK